MSDRRQTGAIEWDEEEPGTFWRVDGWRSPPALPLHAIIRRDSLAPRHARFEWSVSREGQGDEPFAEGTAETVQVAKAVAEAAMRVESRRAVR